MIIFEKKNVKDVKERAQSLLFFRKEHPTGIKEEGTKQNLALVVTEME